MTRPVSRLAIIGAILRKDFVDFSRDTVYVFLSVLGLVAYVVMFWVIPNTVEETIVMGITHTDMDRLIEEYEAGDAEGQGLKLIELDTAEDLEAVVGGSLELWEKDDGGYILRDRETEDKPKDASRVTMGVGVAFPDDFARATVTGETTTVRVFANADFPDEIRGAMTSFVRELAFQLRGEDLPVTLPDEDVFVLGTDRAGAQVSMRERMRPMLAVFVLMIETFALSGLVSREVSQRTVTAILVTPAKLSDVLAAKTVYGTSLAFGQALILLVAVGALTSDSWSIVLASVLIGSVMFCGIGMIVGAAGRDFIGNLFYGMLFTIPMIIPAFATLFPGTAASWVRAIPSYPIMEMLVGATSYGLRWGDLYGELVMALGWVVVLFVLGLIILKRKVESL